MDVVVDKVVAVLQVLTFRDAVGGNQNINVSGITGHQQFLVLGYRRKTGQNGIQITMQTGHGGAAIHVAGNHGGMQPEVFQHIRAHIVVQVFCRVRKGSEDDDLPVVRVDGMFHLVFQHVQQLLQLAVILRRDVPHHENEKLQGFLVLGKAPAPGDIVHVTDLNFDFAANGEDIAFTLVIGIQLVQVADVCQVQCGGGRLVIGIDTLDGIINQFADALEGQIEGIDRALHTFHQVDCHQTANTLLTACLCKADVDLVVLVQLRVFFEFAALDVMAGCIDTQIQKHQLFKNFIVVDGPLQIRQLGTQ